MERGKRICKTLKELRKRIADANGIPYEIEECTHKGRCPGTCPRCEAEVRYLEKALKDKRERGEEVTIKGLMTEEELTLFVGEQNGIDIVREPSHILGMPMPQKDLLTRELEREIFCAVMECMRQVDRYPDVGLFISETDNDVLCVPRPGLEGEALIDYLIYDWRELLDHGLPSEEAIRRLAAELICEDIPQGDFEEFQDGPIDGQETAWLDEPFDGEGTDLLEDTLEGNVIMPAPEPTKIKQVLTSITVAGTSHVKIIGLLAEDIHEGVELWLYRDVNNKYDPNAVAVYFGEYRVGYVPKAKNEIIANLLAADLELIAVVTEAGWRGKWFEIKADIAIPE